MEIEEVKLWQWMLAGLIAGFLFSCVVAWSGPSFENQSRDTLMTSEFECYTYPLATFQKLANDETDRKLRGAAQAKIGNFELYHKDQSVLRYVLVHPPLRGDKEHRWCVTGEYYSVGRSKSGEMQGEWKPFAYAASTPYVPGYAQQINKEIKKDNDDHKDDHKYKYAGGWVPITREDSDMADLKKAMGNKESFPTVAEYLKAVAAMPNSKLTFKQAWWERPPFMWSFPPLAGFLWIGVAWPLTLSILQNIGVAKRAPVKGKPKTLKPELMNIPNTAGVILQPVKSEPPPMPVEAKEYGGEFYPVVKVAHHEEKPAAAAKPAATKPKTAPVKTK